MKSGRRLKIDYFFPPNQMFFKCRLKEKVCLVMEMNVPWDLVKEPPCTPRLSNGCRRKV